MGTLVSGINGPIRGKVGTVVGSSRHGKPYIKGPYNKRTTKVSDKELGNRFRFSLAQKWLKPLKEFLREGFKSYRMTSGAFVAAKSYLQRNAMEGTGKDTIINPALMKVSTGPLELPGNITVAKTSPEQLLFSWDTDALTKENQYDQVMMLAYDPVTGLEASNVTGQFRSTGADVLTVKASGPESVYHIYAAFTSANRETQSESVYLGTITI